VAGIRTGIWGGWVYYDSGEPGEEVFIRFGEDEGGRLFIRDLRIARAEGISTVTLRSLPLGQIEAMANSPELAEVLRETIRIPRPDEMLSDERFWGERAAAGPVPLEVPPEVRRAFGLLDIPKTKKYPDDFYREVALIYSRFARWRRDPAEEIARKNNVLPSTVHRWLREARRRGLLPPGRVRVKSKDR
jgi:hypothetical protein